MIRYTASLITVLIFSLSVPLSGCDPTAKLTEQEHIQRAKDFEDKGDIKGAVIELKNALQKEPNSAQARLLLGQIYVEAGLGAQAEKELRRARELGVKDETVKYLLGQSLLAQRKYQSVLDEIQLGNQTTPRSRASILQLRGDAMLGLRKLENGCGLYKQSLGLDPAHVPSYWGLARCALSMKDTAEAKGQLDAALKLDQSNPTSWTKLGDFERYNNNEQGAEAAYTQALKVDPNHADALVGRSLLYISQVKPEQAKADIDRLHKLDPANPLTQFLQAAQLYSAGNYTAAMDKVQQVQKVLPDYPPALRLTGILHYNLKAYEQSVQSLKNYLADTPGDALARKLMAAAYLKLGYADRALEVLQPMMNGDKDDVQLYALVGQVQLLKKDPAAAAEQFEKAAAIDPKNVGLHTQLGLSLVAAGETQKGIAALQASSGLDPKQIQSDIAMAVIHLQKRQYDKALEALAQLERKLPKEDPFVHELRGVAQIGKNDYASARRSFERALAVDPSSVGSAINLAQLDMRNKNPAAARKRLEGALDKNKNNLQAMLAMASLAAAESKDQEYLDWLVKTAMAHPKVAQPRVMIARYYLGKNQPKQALTSAQEALSAQPNDPAALETFGSVQLAVGDKESAMSTFKRLVARTPDSPTSYYNLASAQAIAGKLVDARLSLKHALDLKADYLDALVALAGLELRDGKPAESLKVALQVKKLFPSSALGAAMEGDALMVQKRYTQAIKAYESAWGIQKNGGLLIKIFDARSLAGAHRDAEARILQWLNENPNDKAVRLHLAQAQMAAGQNLAAIEHYKFVLQREPNNALALNNLAWLYYMTKNPQAIEYAERAYKLHPEAANILDTLGWITLEQGKTARGHELLKKALSLAPKNPAIKYHYAVALARSGDKGQARKMLEELLATGQNFPQQEEARVLLMRL